MFFGRKEKADIPAVWTANLWDRVVGQGTHQNVGIMIDGYWVESNNNYVEKEFRGRVLAEKSSPEGNIPVFLSWITDGYDDLHNGQPQWRWGTARIPWEGRDVYGYIYPTTDPKLPMLRVVLGTDPNGLKLFEDLIVRAKLFGAHHISLHIWLAPLEEDLVPPDANRFHRLMTVSRFIYSQRISL
jgi:hypothetical protein